MSVNGQMIALKQDKKILEMPLAQGKRPEVGSQLMSTYMLKKKMKLHIAIDKGHRLCIYQ